LRGDVSRPPGLSHLGVALVLSTGVLLVRVFIVLMSFRDAATVPR
jgi:hypothetical protein